LRRYYYDDERVEQVTEAKVRRHKEEAYLLFYERQTG
jgi:ubiquitin C-terminal hydrolase